MIAMDILVILDRSGSMEDARTDHEGGLKSFVRDQQDLAGDVRFTLVQFDTENPCEIVYDRTPIADVKHIQLIPRGGTPLLDAMGKAMAHLSERQSHEPADMTVCMIITDGEENASREWTKERIKARVSELEKSVGWTFLFLGANVDAFSEAASVGVGAATSVLFAMTPQSVNSAYSNTSRNVLRSRGIRASGGSMASASGSLSYTSAQRLEIMNGAATDNDGCGSFDPPATTETAAGGYTNTVSAGGGSDGSLHGGGGAATDGQGKA